METRRQFVKKAMLLAAAAGVTPAIERALGINPNPGTTWKDAEHVVILMQENRSFDHLFGTLRGVRGFNDPRAISLPNGNPVWLQTNAAGETYSPFRLDIKATNATWVGSLPHSWVDQVDARNHGKHDGWLDAKRSSNKQCAHLPMTLGYYTRADLGFYYALADAFTVCDQNFCSSLTGTTPNRLYLWSGTIREKPSLSSKACVRNEDVDYDHEVGWTTFPERLEEANVSWRVYQNEISLPSGLEGEADAWLSNFTDNPLEWFSQYHVRHNAFRRQQAARQRALVEQLNTLEKTPEPRAQQIENQLKLLREELEQLKREREDWNGTAFTQLPVREQNLHRKAFTTNENDPNYRELVSIRYKDDEMEREMKVPKGDVLHQFRQDVRNGKLPTVSWIVAPERFSDHPGSPWYGAWYLSETLDILTQNPEIWKKTIFILCYDENDGCFDHIPPFVPPDPASDKTGKTTEGIDTAAEYVSTEQEEDYSKRNKGAAGRTGPIGLGFRVPLVVASPWSRGGYVCSQVFDHTSIIQFLEQFLTHKTGRPIRETNITGWRRTVCGDLTSVFRNYEGESKSNLTRVDKDAFFASIHQAQYQKPPSSFPALDSAQVTKAKTTPRQCSFLPQQEPGDRPSCALPYGLSVDGWFDPTRNAFAIRFSAMEKLFGKQAAGAPFRVNSLTERCSPSSSTMQKINGAVWNYTIAAGAELNDLWPLEEFTDKLCHLEVRGPNGFYRRFKCSTASPALRISAWPTPQNVQSHPSVSIDFKNIDATKPLTVIVEQTAYAKEKKEITLQTSGKDGDTAKVDFNLESSHGWYELKLTVSGYADFEQIYAGHIENGKESRSDPLLS